MVHIAIISILRYALDNFCVVKDIELKNCKVRFYKQWMALKKRHIESCNQPRQLAMAVRYLFHCWLWSVLSSISRSPRIRFIWERSRAQRARIVSIWKTKTWLALLHYCADNRAGLNTTYLILVQNWEGAHDKPTVSYLHF
jgi:hypothetical protein